MTDSASAPALSLEANEKLITILGTNDIHGGVDVGTFKDGTPAGGLAHFAGIVKAVRKGLASRFGADRAGVLLVDAGDQFQGTLLSNFNEGQLLFAAMNDAGYDAVVPGNHDYDFGPIGWLEDQVTPTSADQNPRGSLLRLVSQAKFPLISANTFLRESFADRSGSKVDVENSFCRVKSGSGGKIDWRSAKRPSFLVPYVVKKTAGVRVALIGLDNPSTPTTTTAANVSDLCFDDTASAYARVHKELKGKADVFVVVIHDGNTDDSFDVSKFVEQVPQGSVDAVVSGHTHWLTNTRTRGVPIIQSGSGGLSFGRIDLVYDPGKGIVASKTRSFGGVQMALERCAPQARSFCEDRVDADGSKSVAYEGVTVVPSRKIQALVEEARREVAPIADRKLGVAKGLVKVDRTRESPLANALTDALRSVTSTDIAFMNTGGIRAPLQPGDVTYEDFYKVLPFGNHALVIGPMPAEKVLGLLERSVRTCGSYGALMQSGLRVSFVRDCSPGGRARGQVDSQARLLKVETLDGEVLYEAERGRVAPAGRSFQVATLDFLAAGGSGFDGFKGTPVISDAGIAREVMVEHFMAHPMAVSPEVDGRWKESRP